MAGAIRQPIDLASLERYIASNVPEIKVPLDIKQVRKHGFDWDVGVVLMGDIVWIWPIESHVSVDGQDWQEICYAKEASRAALVEDSSPGRTRIPDPTRPRKHKRAGA